MSSGNPITSGGTIGAGAVGTNELAAKSVTAAKIADNTITFAQLQSGGTLISGSQIAATSITGTQIAVGTITGTNIVNQTIDTAQIKDGAVTAAKVAAGVIGVPADGTISPVKLSAALQDMIPTLSGFSSDGGCGATFTIKDANGNPLLTPVMCHVWVSEMAGGPAAATGMEEHPTVYSDGGRLIASTVQAHSDYAMFFVTSDPTSGQIKITLADWANGSSFYINCAVGNSLAAIAATGGAA